MGNTYCMTTPNTAAATGSPVKLTTYAGVPLHALVAYERAALNLLHSPEELQRQAREHLQAAMKPSSSSTQNRDQVATPFFSSASLRILPDGAQPLHTQNGVIPYVDGVPLWLQEVAQLWNASIKEKKSGSSSSVNDAATGRSASSFEFGAEKQAVWVSGTTQQLRDFVSTQKYAKALQRARAALKKPAPSSLVFFDLMRSYAALSRSIQSGGTAASSKAEADTPIRASMWCVLLCSFLRALPKPLMPPLCSRRLEPLLAQFVRHPVDTSQQKESTTSYSTSLSGTHHRTALTVLLDSFASINVVDYVTFCFLLNLAYAHRSELTGGEVEMLASAMVGESTVPHVVRAVAHTCKPEARMFWPATETKSNATSNSIQKHRKTSSEAEKGQIRSVGGRAGEHAQWKTKKASAGRNRMALSREDEEEDEEMSDSTHDSGSDVADSTTANNDTNKKRQQHEGVVTTEENAASISSASSGSEKSSKETTNGNVALQIMRWHDSSTSSSSASSNEESSMQDASRFDVPAVEEKKKSIGDAAVRNTLSSRKLTSTSAVPNEFPAVSKVEKGNTVQDATAVSCSPPPPSTAAAALAVDAPSLGGISPVRMNDPSLLSRHSHNGTTVAEEEKGDVNNPAVLLSQPKNNSEKDVHEGEEEAMPSAFASQPEPTPLRVSRNNSTSYPSALEDPLAEETAAEALRRALQTFSDAPSSSVPTRDNSPSHSPHIEKQRRSHGATTDASNFSNGGSIELRSLVRLPSPPSAAVLLTPRDVLQQQQQREQRAQLQQQQRPPLSSTEMPTRSATVSLTGTSYHCGVRTQPLQMALLEAKLRFMAAPVLSSFAREKTLPTLSGHPSDAGRECGSTAGLRRELACDQDQGVSSETLLAALPNGQSSIHAQTVSNSSSTQPTGNDRRELIKLPPNKMSTPEGTAVTNIEEEEGGRAKNRKANGHRVRSTAAPVRTSLPEVAAADMQGVGAVRDVLSGSSIVTPEDTVFSASVNVSALEQNSNAVASLSSLSAMRRELRRLRDAVRTLEANQFVQARQAAAQVSELTARCIELQRQQREQAQQFSSAQSRLKDVSHELEDLKDDKARLVMQLMTARQEGAKLRDAFLTGKIRV